MVLRRVRRSNTAAHLSSYFAVEIEKPGGYEELKVVKKDWQRCVWTKHKYDGESTKKIW